MRISKLSTLLLGALLLSSTCCFAADQANHIFSVEVVKAQIHFKKDDIASATFVKFSDDNYGVKIVLKTKAAQALQDLTSANVGRKANVVHDDKILVSVTIQSALAGEFMLSGMSEDRAKEVVANLS